MSKPILVVNYCVDSLPMSVAVQNLKSIKEVVEGSGANEDYYTFVLPIRGDSKIEVFYDKDLDKSAFNNIRAIIDKKLDDFTENHKTDEEQVMKELEGYAAELYPHNKPRKRLFPWRKRKG